MKLHFKFVLEWGEEKVTTLLLIKKLFFRLMLSPEKWKVLAGKIPLASGNFQFQKGKKSTNLGVKLQRFQYLRTLIDSKWEVHHVSFSTGLPDVDFAVAGFITAACGYTMPDYQFHPQREKAEIEGTVEVSLAKLILGLLSK